MEAQKLQTSIDTILKWRAEWREYDNAASQFFERRNCHPAYNFIFGVYLRDLRDKINSEIPTEKTINEVLIRDKVTKEGLYAAVSAYIQGLPHFNEIPFLEEHARAIEIPGLDNEEQNMFSPKNKFLKENILVKKILLETAKKNIEKDLRTYNWSSPLELELNRRLFGSIDQNYLSEVFNRDSIEYSEVINCYYITYDHAKKIVQKNIGLELNSISEQSSMVTSALNLKKEDLEEIFAQATEENASFQFLVPFASTESVASLESSLAMEVDCGLVKVSNINLHSEKDRSKFIETLMLLEKHNRDLHRQNYRTALQTIEEDLHAYRRAFYDAHNSGRYVKTLSEEASVPVGRRWYAGPSVLEAEQIIAKAYQKVAEINTSCTQKAEDLKKGLRAKYGILDVHLYFSSVLDDYYTPSEIIFKNKVFKDSSHKKLVQKAVEYYREKVY